MSQSGSNYQPKLFLYAVFIVLPSHPEEDGFHYEFGEEMPWD